MVAHDTLTLLAVGAIVGAAGQGGRAVVGIEKAKQEATDEEIEKGTWWDPRRLYLSLFIGAVAGVLFVAVGIEGVSQRMSEGQTQGVLMTLVGVGYAGTDFIEGVLKGPARRGRRSGGDGSSGGQDGDEGES